jgi:hypothetical protein
MKKNPFLDAAMSAKDDFKKNHALEIEKITLQGIDLQKLLPKQEDQAQLQELRELINRQSTSEAKKKIIEDNLGKYAGHVLDIARKLSIGL